MEELLLALLHFVFEVVLQTLVSFPFDILLDVFPERFELSGSNLPSRNFSLIFAGAFIGAALGLLSVWVVPLVVIHTSLLRVGTLVFSPFLVALSARSIANVRRKHGKEGAVPEEHFWMVLGLSGAFLLVRFCLAGR